MLATGKFQALGHTDEKDYLKASGFPATKGLIIRGSTLLRPRLRQIIVRKGRELGEMTTQVKENSSMSNLLWSQSIINSPTEKEDSYLEDN